jgi:hypothetical protein
MLALKHPTPMIEDALQTTNGPTQQPGMKLPNCCADPNGDDWIEARSIEARSIEARSIEARWIEAR